MQRSYFDKLLLWRVRHINDKIFMLFLSVFVGIAVGLAAVLMKTAVHFVREIAVYIIDVYSSNYLYIVFPAVGIFLTVLFVTFVIKKQLGHGIPMVLHNMSQNEGKIERHNMFSRIIASSLTVGFGGSVGLEGPIVATGAAIGSNVGQLFRLNYKQIILLIGCASAGAIAAIFKAPITGVIFAVEVIMIDLTTTVMLPLLTASISAALTSFIFLGQSYLYTGIEQFSFIMGDTPFYIVLGILCGLLSVYFSKLYLWQNKVFKRIKNRYVKYCIGSIILGLLIFLFPPLYGEGYESVSRALTGDTTFIFENALYAESNSKLVLVVVIALILLLKTFATGATFAAGGAGGIFAPSLFLGALLGMLFVTVGQACNFNISSTSFILTSMAGVMAGVIHAPLTAIFMIAEMTGGYSLFVPLMIVSAISFFTTKLFMPNSVYTTLLAKRGELLTHNPDNNMLTLMKTTNLIETNFLTIGENATLRQLTKTISHSSRTLYVVVDEENNFKGLVWLDHIKHLIFETALYDSTFVRDLMFTPNYILNTQMSVKQIVEIFEVSENYNLPVVDDGKYVGFVSRAKVFTTYREMMKHMSND